MSTRDLLLTAYLAVCTLALTGVVLRGPATADGLVLGLPSGLAFVTFWAVVTPLVMWAYTATRPPEGDVDEDDA